MLGANCCPAGLPGPPGPDGPQGMALTFANPAAVAAFDATSQPDFQLASVGVVNDSYRFLTAPSANVLAAADGLNVILPAAPANSAFVRLYDQNLPAQYETTWFIDPVAGLDTNSGNTIGAPLKTLTEWCRRMNGATVAQDVLITCAAGTITGDMIISLNIVSPALITIQGNVTEDAGHAVTGVTASNPVAQTRGFINSADAFTDKQRLRFTGNVTAALTDALASVSGINSVATSAFISTPAVVADLSPPNGAIPTTGFPAIDDTYVVQTFNTILSPPTVDINVIGYGRLCFKDLAFSLVVGGRTNIMHVQNNNPGSLGSSVLFYNCQGLTSVDTIAFSDSQAFLTNCCFDGLLAAFDGSVLSMSGNVYRKIAQQQSFGACYAGVTSYMAFYGSHLFDSGALVGDKCEFEFNQADIQVVDGPTSGTGSSAWFTLGVGTTVYSHQGSRTWGPSTGSGFVRSFALFTGALMTYVNIPTVFSVNTPADITMNAILLKYTDVPYANAPLATFFSAIT